MDGMLTQLKMSPPLNFTEAILDPVVSNLSSWNTLSLSNFGI